LRLYGEWLVPHTIKNYEKSSWYKFYVFDVVFNNCEYLPYSEYLPKLIKFGIDYVPAECYLNPTLEQLNESVMKNRYLISSCPGSPDSNSDDNIGEGIVIKNYEYKINFPSSVWEKIIAPKFKETFTDKFHNINTKNTTQENREFQIVDRFMTLHLIEKNYAKIKCTENCWLPKFIPILVINIATDLLTEEIKDILEMYNFNSTSKIITDINKILNDRDTISANILSDNVLSCLKTNDFPINFASLKSNILRKAKAIKPTISQSDIL
jgi:hypothetical protein